MTFLGALAASALGPTVESAGDSPATPAAKAPDSPEVAEVAQQERLSDEFGRFYDRTKIALRGYLAAATRDGGLADDLTQEAFIRLFTAKGPFANDEHRRRYLFRIASNLLTDHWRTARHAALPLDEARLESSQSSSKYATLQGSAPDPGARRDLARALGRLLPRDRQLVWLAHVEHLSHRDIAAVVGVGEASVRVLLFRARKRLAELLRGVPFDPQPHGGAE